MAVPQQQEVGIKAESHRYDTIDGMGVDVQSITVLSREIALQQGRGLDVQTVTLTDGGSDHAEVIVTIGGCHQQPCRFLLSVNRSSSDVFEREFREKLSDALRRHQAS